MVEQFDRALRQAGTRIVDGIANALPGALVFLVIVLGAFVIARSLRYAVQRALRRLDADPRGEFLGVSLTEWTSSRTPSVFVASVVYWSILGIGLMLGLTALDATLPSEFAVAVLHYVPHLAAAVVILVVGNVVARFLARAMLIGAVNMGVHQARLLSIAVKWLVLIVAGAMALDHIGIGRTVLLLAFGILFGGVVFAASLAVGLGARDAVRRGIERQARATAPDDKLDHV